jgi:signal transduction histidine kinase
MRALLVGLLLALAFPLLLFAQRAPAAPVPARADSVEVQRWRARVRAHPQPDTVRLVLLTWLGNALQARDVRSARPVLLAAVALARQLAYRDFLAETLLDLADYHVALAQYDSATTCVQASARAFKKLRDLGGEVRCLGRLGRMADQQGRYVASLDYTYRGLALATTGDTRRFNTSLKIQLATIYAEVGDYAAARRYLGQALQAATHYDYPDRLNLALGELGEVCRQQRQWAAARTYLTRSIAVSQRIKNTPYVLAMRLRLARLAEDQQQYAAAAAEGQQVLARLQAAHQPLLIPQAQALLARTALHQGTVVQAVAYGRQSLAGSRQMRLLAGIREASAVLADAYTRQRAYAPALAALRQYTVANDSLVGAATRRRAAVQQFGEQQREQQAQIKVLTQQNHLQQQAQEVARLRSQRALIALSALSLLLLLLAGGGLWGYRRRQAQRETRLRTQIAADLHDDVGTLLSQISLQSSLLQTGLADATGQRQQLSQIAEASRSAVRQLNDVVWSLDAHNDTLPQLLERLRDYAYEVLTPADIAVVVDAPTTVPDVRLSLLLRRNLYLIYKEALHNILKHAAGAGRVHVQLTLGGSRLHLSIRNDASPPAHQRRSGHGLRNMAQRAAAVGGTATSGWLPEGGFWVRVELPLEG